jgi:hypothetical protein
MMAADNKKPLMRCFGEFVGHIVHAMKTNSSKREVNRSVEEKKEGNVTLRRTTIDEIEINQEDKSGD